MTVYGWVDGSIEAVATVQIGSPTSSWNNVYVSYCSATGNLAGMNFTDGLFCLGDLTVDPVPEPVLPCDPGRWHDRNGGLCAEAKEVLADRT